MLDYYFYVFDINKYIYSLDMLRINFELKKEFIDDFNKMLNDFSYDVGCDFKRFINKNGVGYHYLYNFIIEDFNFNKCSFVIGLGLNFIKDNEDKGFIEFNPNKCFKLELFNKYFNIFKNLCYTFKVVRYDLAIDLPFKRDNFKMVRNLRSNYEYLYNENKEGLILNRSVTEYQGRRNHNKFTKLYDKTKESNLNFDLTRIEFTFDRDENSFKNLPKFLYIKDSKIDLTNNNKIFLFLLMSSEDINFYLKSLSYRLRKKFDFYLNDYYIKFNIDNFRVIRDLALGFEF